MAFMQGLLSHYLRMFNGNWKEMRSRLVIVMDNARYHHSAWLCQQLSYFGITVIYNAAIAPTLNPIELAFNCWKDYVRFKTYDDVKELTRAVVRGSLRLTRSKVRSFFAHALWYCGLILQAQVDKDKQ